MTERRNDQPAANTEPEDDPTAGLPDDLAALLRDPSIIVPADQAVFNLVASWMNAPSDTMSALPHVKPPTASPIDIAKERQRDD